MPILTEEVIKLRYLNPVIEDSSWKKNKYSLNIFLRMDKCWLGINSQKRKRETVSYGVWL